MFIWDFAADTVLGQIFDWVYARIVEFLGEFFTMMNGMGTELFELVWVQAGGGAMPHRFFTVHHPDCRANGL